MNQSTLSQRVAIVTHGTSDMGHAISVALQNVGVQVVIGDGANIIALIERAVVLYGRLDIMVNVHRITKSEPAVTMSLATFLQGIELNLDAMFFGCQHAARQMMTQSPTGGRIINVTSVAGVVALAGHADFCAAMAGVNAITKTLATEWQPHGIRVGGIGAGLSEEWVKALSLHPTLPDSATLSHRRMPAHTLTHADDIAEAVVYLASAEARHINGTTLYVDGGWLADGYWE
jgi:NAD(P)-dependent dehydrogenase (short-subunit alcohol dehydrogenase family)